MSDPTPTPPATSEAAAPETPMPTGESRFTAAPAAPIRTWRSGMRLRYGAFAHFIRAFSKLYNRAEVTGVENVPMEGPVLLLPTHCSFFDPPLVGGHLRRESYYLSRDGILKVPVIGSACVYLNTYPLRRGAADREALRACRDILSHGWPLIFFPEGTRSADGTLGELKPGWAMILDGVPGVPWLPVMLQDTYNILNRRMAFPRPAKLRIRFGKPEMLPERLGGERARDYYERCNTLLAARYRELGARFPESMPSP